MGAERQQNIVTSLPILAMLAIIAGAYYISRLPLESSRPESPLGLEHVVPEEDKIDARLWQDPIKVALDHEKAMHREKNPQNRNPRWQCTSNHSVHEQLVELISRFIGDERKTQNEQGRADSDVPAVHVLMIMVRDGNFAEDHERRLRNRYAVLTALYASGLTPEDSKHIQYFRLEWTGKQELEEDICNNRVPKIAPVLDEASRTIIVPFECFKRTELDPAAFKPECPDYAAVVWLPESAFSHRPLTRLAQVIDAIGHRQSNDVRIDIVGPSYSDTLLEMLKEIVKLCGKDGQSKNDGFNYVHLMLGGLTIFSPWSTASPVLLMREAYPDALKSHDSLSKMFSEIPEKFQDLDINFLRTIGSDDLLAMELINELRRRGVDLIEDKGNVALITEWDTFYGQAFPLTFTTMMNSIDPKDPNGVPDWHCYTNNLVRNKFVYSFPDNLHIYTYIRGIDGKLSESQQSKETKSNQQTELESKWTYTKSLELPIGRSQLDYARRLSQDLKEEWEQSLKRKPAAIGVVGSDVYDKLILLHALREQFGNVIIFMTDLDARFMHHEQSKWTRNVIVSSNFDLKLHETYHSYMLRNLPPFRDNYQTSLFFACRASLGLCEHENGTLFREMCQEQLANYLKHPRLFEIGRGRAVDISVRNADIHPERCNLFDSWASFWLSMRIRVLLSVGAIGLCLLVFLPLILTMQFLAARRKKTTDSKRSTWCKIRKALWVAFWLSVGFALIFVFAFIVIRDHYLQAEGEPFSLVTGVSIWPGEALRLVALILSAGFIAMSWKMLRKNEEELDSQFKLRQIKSGLLMTLKKWLKIKNPNNWKNRLISWPSYRRRIGIYGWRYIGDQLSARVLWRDYLSRATFGNRFRRLIRMSMMYGLFGLALMQILTRPNTPYRGDVSWTVDLLLLLLSVISMIVLIFFVADATRLSLTLIHNLKEPKTHWPKELVELYGESKGSHGLAEWLDIKFIASHTEAVGKLIYFPFIVLLVMFVARNRYFDNWNFPISLIILFLLNATYALCCACMLRHEAEKTRRVALDRLQKERVEAMGCDDESLTRQLGAMIEEIESIRQGAYSPFTANPVLHAILIPSGGISLVTLLRFLVLS
jgi:hypothetical protein